MPFRLPVWLLISAVIGLIPSPSLAQRQISEEAKLFRRLKSGVCTIYSESGLGSGFLVDSLGLVITNDHVAAGSRRIRVKFDDSTKVDANILAADDKRDIAVLRVHPDVIRGLAVLHLATPSDTMVFEGEKVIAMGSPLNQEKIMTSGIVSKIEPTAVISDVNINHGNSGGPLVNLNGDVIAVNTFGDFTSQGGPGVSGSILISEALPVLAEAKARLDSAPVPRARRLPVASKIPFPVDSLRASAERQDFKRSPYEVSGSVSTGKFIVTIVTPVYDAWRTWRAEVEMSKNTKRREAKGGTSTTSSEQDPLRQMRNWMRYTDDAYAPFVTIQIAPKIGQTAGSLFGNILGAAASGMAGSTYYRGSYRYEYKADFLNAELWRDTTLVDDLNTFRTMIPTSFATSNWDGEYVMQDQARSGIYQCDPRVFEPVDGVPPRITLKVWSVDRPDKPLVILLPETTVQRVWNDFGPWRRVALAE